MDKELYQPTVSIVIPTYNEEKNIKRCLDSVFNQDYPKDLLEVFVVDNGSQDKTLEIARQYPVKILYNTKIKDCLYSKTMALHQATGDLFLYLDADNELRGKHWFQKMILPLNDDPEIIGSFTKMYQTEGDNSLNRFLTYDHFQRDPVYQFFSPGIEKTITEVRNNYFLCQYKVDKITPEGRCLYWRKKLLNTEIAAMDKFMELDNLVILVKNGYNKFAYVPSAGYYHYHASSLKELLKKRLRNIKKNYLPDYEKRYYTWFNLKNKRDVLKIIFWIIYANLIIPAFLKGCYKALKYRDIMCVWYEPFLTVLLTDVIIYGFLRDKRGWKFFLSIFK